MSSEGCRINPLVTGSFGKHLENRVLSLQDLGSDLESDDSIYYDIDSLPSSPHQSTMNSAVPMLKSPPSPASSSSEASPDFVDCQTFKLTLRDIPEGSMPNGFSPPMNGVTESENHSPESNNSFIKSLEADAEIECESDGNEFSDLVHNHQAQSVSESCQTDDLCSAIAELSVEGNNEEEVSAEDSGEAELSAEDKIEAEFDSQQILLEECESEKPKLFSEISFCDSDDDDIDVRPELKRCSSLKTTKILEGTTCEKKIVRFADAMGLDLAAVRTFMDDIPKVPKSAYRDLEGVETFGCSPSNSPLLGASFSPQPRPPEPTKTILALFQQPIHQSDFEDRLKLNKVCLETATISDMNLCSIVGVVRVLNLDYHKAVFVRYSKDNWKTFYELQAKYVDNSCNGFSDKFMFTLFAHTLNIGERMEFALRYVVNSVQYWDNNRNSNYAFQCVPESPTKSQVASYMPSSISLDSWGTFI